MSAPEGDWPPPLPADVNPDDVDAAALWQKWIDEEPVEGEPKVTEPAWTEAEIRAALKGHDSYASDDGDEGCNVHCDCDDWTGFHLEHVLDVLKASHAAGVEGNPK